MLNRPCAIRSGGVECTPMSGQGRDRDRRLLRTRVLTGRELEILRLVAEGMSNDEIGDRLHLSPRTVQTHIASALKKTDTRNRAQLAVLGLREGVVPFEPPPEPRRFVWDEPGPRRR